MNPRNIKRYHIARVYRRDQPAMNRGRYREFYQCVCALLALLFRSVRLVCKCGCEIWSDMRV